MKKFLVIALIAGCATQEMYGMHKIKSATKSFNLYKNIVRKNGNDTRRESEWMMKTFLSGFLAIPAGAAVFNVVGICICATHRANCTDIDCECHKRSPCP